MGDQRGEVRWVLDLVEDLVDATVKVSLKVLEKVLFSVQAILDEAFLDQGDEDIVVVPGQGVSVELLAVVVVLLRARRPRIVEGRAESDTTEIVGGQTCPTLQLLEPVGGALADLKPVEIYATISFSAQKYPSSISVHASSESYVKWNARPT